MFLMVKGAKHGLIKGEAQDDQHKDEIEVLSWSWGMQAKAIARRRHRHREGDHQRAEDREAGRQRLDALMSALRTNELIQKAVLTLRKAGKTPARVPEDHDRAGPRDRRSTIEAGDTTRQPGRRREGELLVQQDRGRVHASGEGRAAAGRHDVRGSVE